LSFVSAEAVGAGIRRLAPSAMAEKEKALEMRPVPHELKPGNHSGQSIQQVVV